MFERLCGTRDSAGWWEAEPAIFLRSVLDFDAMWSHLRKHHRVMDADGNWLFLRYCDPELLLRMVENKLPVALAVMRQDTDIIARFGPHLATLEATGDPPPRPAALRPGDVELIGAMRTGRRHRTIAAMMRDGFPEELAETDDATLHQKIGDALDAADRLGLKNGQSRAKFAIMSVVTVPGLDKDRSVLAHLEHSADPDQGLRDLNDVIRARVRDALKKEQG